jgi:hypothetical protein
MVNIPGLGAGIGQIASQPINPDPAQTPGGFNTGGLMRQVIEALLHGDTETAAQGIMQGRQADPEFDTTLQEALTDLHNTPESPIALSPSSPEPQGDENTFFSFNNPTEDQTALVGGDQAELDAETFLDQLERFNRETGEPIIQGEERAQMLDQIVQSGALDNPQIAQRFRPFMDEVEGVEPGKFPGQAEGDALPKKEDPNAGLTRVERMNPFRLFTNPFSDVFGIGEDGEPDPKKVEEAETAVLPAFSGKTDEERMAALEKFKSDMLASIDAEFAEQSGIKPELLLLAALQTLGSFFGGTGNINPLLFNEIQRKGALDRRRAEARTEVQSRVSEEELRMSQEADRQFDQMLGRIGQLAQLGDPTAMEWLRFATVDPDGFREWVESQKKNRKQAK